MFDAADYYERYWFGRGIPVDPEEIAKEAGVFVEYLPEDVPDSFSGEYNPQGTDGKPTIRYNKNHPLWRQRFTIAHELGHHALGHGLSYRDDNQGVNINNFDPYKGRYAEIRANTFAAELLMPEIYVREYIRRHKNTTSESIASYFEVSQSAIFWRLKNLGIVRDA